MLTHARRPASQSSLSFAALGAAAALLLTAAWLVAAPHAEAAETVTVDIADFAFDPGSVTIQVGDTVTWTNNDTVPHTATSTDESTFDGEMQPGESFSFTFENEGTFDYFCEIHPQMEGTVVVEAGDIPDGAMSATDGRANPMVALGIALVALSLLVGIGVARRRAGSAA